MSGEITSMDPSMPGNVIMIVLDDEAISAPQVSSVIPNGEAVITSSRVGGFDQNEAMQTAALIRGGALPVGLTEVNSGTQTAKIGESAFEQSIVAGAIGLALIFIIMIIFYGIMGIAADVSLLLYVVIDLWIMVLWARYLHAGYCRYHTFDRYGGRCKCNNILTYQRRNYQRKKRARGCRVRFKACDRHSA